jgi:hypothetical protein
MRPDNKGLFAMLLAVTIVVAIGGVVILSTAHPTTLPIALPIPAGTVVDDPYNVSFTVSGGIGRLVGAWHSERGGLVWVYPSNSPPSGTYNLPCIGFAPWDGTVNVSLLPGTYTMQFEDVGGASVLITQTIRLVYPGEPPGTNETMVTGGC